LIGKANPDRARAEQAETSRSISGALGDDKMNAAPIRESRVHRSETE
jgi:hypothetical protein